MHLQDDYCSLSDRFQLAYAPNEFDGVQYSTVREAKELLEQRRPLRKEIEAWWKEKGWVIPAQVMNFSSVGVFGKPPLATCRYEDALFIEYCARAQLKPTWMPYAKGLLSSESPTKRSLLHPTFFEKRGARHDGMVVRKRKLGNIELNRAKPLVDVQLNCGTNIVSYHRRMHEKFGLPDDSVVDLSDFYAQFQFDCRKYYWGYLSFFIAHCVLFDDYHDGEEGKRILRPFRENVFLPVYRAIVWELGLKPIIVRFPWHNNLRYYIPDSEAKNWRTHRVVPDELLSLK